MRNLFYLLLIFVFSSYGVFSLVENVQRPSDIYDSQNIQKVIVANRSILGKGNLGNNIIEGLVTRKKIVLPPFDRIQEIWERKKLPHI